MVGKERAVVKTLGRPGSVNIEPPNPDRAQLVDLPIRGIYNILNYMIPGMLNPPSATTMAMINGDVERNRLAESEPQNTRALQTVLSTQMQAPLWGDDTLTRNKATGKLVPGIDSQWLRDSLASTGADAQPFRSAFQQHLATGSTSNNIEVGKPATKQVALNGVSKLVSSGPSKDVIDTMIAEAGGNLKGLHAVAAVINNRTSQLGKTPDQVVKQSGQFEGYSNPGRASREAQKSPHIRALAEKAYNDIVSGAVPDPTNGGTQFRAASASGVLGKNVVNIGGNVFKLGNAPSSAVAAIDAVAPVPRSIPTSLSAYADTPAVALPPLPVPRPSNPEGIRSVEINPDGTLKQPAVFPSRSDTLLPFAGGLTAQPQGAGDSWGPESGRWGPGNFANALPQDQPPSNPLFVSEDRPRSNVPVPSGLTSRSVHTVQIDPFTGNPIGSNTPFVSADHPLSNAVAAPASPKTIYYNSTAGNVALPKGVVPASVTRDLASIAAQQMNRSGSPDDRQSPAPQIAPTPMPARPSALNAPYIPGPNGYTVANKDASSLQPTTPLAFGDAIQPISPAAQAIQQATSKTILNPAYTAALKAGQAYTAGGNIVTQAQQNAFGGLSVPVPAPKPLPPKYITVAAPRVQSVPLPRPRPQLVPVQQRPTGGLLGLLFPGTNPAALSSIAQGISGMMGGSSAPVQPAAMPGSKFLSDRGISPGLTIGQQQNNLMAALSGNRSGSV